MVKGVRVLKPCVYRGFSTTPQGVWVWWGCGTTKERIACNFYTLFYIRSASDMNR